MSDKGYFYILCNAGARIWIKALHEISVIVVVSLTPLLAGIWRDLLIVEPPTMISEAILRAFFGGQLVFYAVGLGATIYWLSKTDLKNFDGWRSFFQLFVIAIVVAAAVMIGHDPSLARTNLAYVGPFSASLFAVSIILYILITVINHAKPDVPGSISRSDEDLGSALRRSREIQQ